MCGAHVWGGPHPVVWLAAAGSKPRPDRQSCRRRAVQASDYRAVKTGARAAAHARQENLEERDPARSYLGRGRSHKWHCAESCCWRATFERGGKFAGRLLATSLVCQMQGSCTPPRPASAAEEEILERIQTLSADPPTYGHSIGRCAPAAASRQCRTIWPQCQAGLPSDEV